MKPVPQFHRASIPSTSAPAYERKSLHGARPGRLKVFGVLCLIWSLEIGGLAHAADLNAQMHSLFANSGAMANATGPGAFKSQTQNIYYGGDLEMRFPTRNYQLWSVTLPSIKAGCGGIDAHMGSFSHINSAQFKQMLQQIGSNTVGLLFKAALASINPLIESKISDLGKDILAVGSANRNSCQMAEALVQGAQGIMDGDTYAQCRSQARLLYGDDSAAADKRCKDDPMAVNSDVKASGDANVKAMAQRDMNLIWEALSGSAYSIEEKEAFMNIAGSILLYKASNNGGIPQKPRPIQATVDSLNVLLNGNAPGDSADTVKITDWQSCASDLVDCMTPKAVDKQITPFPTYVRQQLEGLRDSMANSTQPTVSQIAFINMTTVPVYKMLLVGKMSDANTRDGYLSNLLIARYAKVISYDYAYTFMVRALKDVRTHIAAARLQNNEEVEQAKSIRDNVDKMLVAIELERKHALDRVPAMNAVVDDIQRVEREMRQGLPTVVRNMLDFSNLMTGKGSRS